MVNVSMNKKYISIDTETENNIPFIATSSKYIDSKIQSNLYDIENENHYQNLKSICESPDYIKIFHAATYDIYALSLININVVPPYHCTLIMASLINEHFQSKKLKELARVELDEKCEEEIALKKLKKEYEKKCKNENKKFSYKMIPKNILYPYSIKDSVYTLKLFFKYKDIIKKEYLDIYNMERELIPVVVDMQKRGVIIDRQFCFKEKERIKRLMINEYNKIVKFAGFIPNINASSDLIKILKLSGAKLDKKTEKGNISTDKFVMKSLAKQGNQIAKSIVAYKTYNKQISTYYNKLLYEYTSKKDSIARFLFWQSGTKTGRFSADLIQTIPRDIKEEEKELFGVENNIRKAFVPRKGYVNFYFDYNQMEMRMYTHFSKDKKLLHCFKNNIDIHTDTAISLWGEEKVKNNPGYRRMAKNINFGILYGSGTAKLADVLNIPIYDAIVILHDYYRKYPTVKPFMREIINYVCRTGTLYNSIFKRKYHIKKEHAYKGLNVLIQGCVSGDSRIYIKNRGYIQIKNCLQNKPIEIWDGDKFVKAECTFSGNKKEVIIEFYNGQKIHCSPDHMFASTRYGKSLDIRWIRASDLKCRDVVLVANKVRIKDSEKIKYHSCYKHKPFYKTSRVKSINITDKEIPMYDIVNSESGRFMINGLIVHNSCAYIIKKAMIKIHKYLKEQNIDAYILLQEHDELVVEVSEKYFEDNRVYDIINTIKGFMEDHKTFLLPIIVEIKHTKTSWADKQKWIEKRIYLA